MRAVTRTWRAASAGVPAFAPSSSICWTCRTTLMKANRIRPSTREGESLAPTSDQSRQYYSPLQTKQRQFNASTPRHYTTTTIADPTIYALSTAPGRAAIAIIRISGPASLPIARALTPKRPAPKPRHATVRTLVDPREPAQILDPSALLLYFPGPKTATGEDVVELHVHGGPATVKAVLAAIPRATSEAVRYAEPGEFTRRAFMNDRLDLTQVEALGDVLAATTEQQRKLSVRGAAGGLARRYETWRGDLVAARGELEALIDFSEDQHFDEGPGVLCASVAGQVKVLVRALRAHRENAVRGELLRGGIGISLLGAPNAGKSSLLNRVVGREAAIVSQEAGTTRDVVEVGLDLGGFFVRLGDTAGLRTAGVKEGEVEREVIGRIEREGMKRAKARARESDVVLVVLSLESRGDGSVRLYLDDEVLETARELVREKGNVVVAINKVDMLSSPTEQEAALQAALEALPGLQRERVCLISCKSSTSTLDDPNADEISDNNEGTNIPHLLQTLIMHFHTLTTALTPPNDDGVPAEADPSIWHDSLGATERHRVLLEECIESLDAFLREVSTVSSGEKRDDAADEHEDGDDIDVVLAAEHLRSAADCLARITGRGEAGDVEEVLGVVFEKFCVGK